MRYSISNAIPHNPKSKKHPYETLANTGFVGIYLLSKGTPLYSLRGKLFYPLKDKGDLVLEYK